MADSNHITLEQLRAELAPIAARLEHIDARLDRIDARLDRIEPRIDGIPLINRKLIVIEQELRSLKAAFNDFARTNVTAGEIEALHSDVNRVQAENAELTLRLITLERMAREHGWIKSAPS